MNFPQGSGLWQIKKASNAKQMTSPGLLQSGTNCGDTLTSELNFRPCWAAIKTFPKKKSQAAMMCLKSHHLLGGRDRKIRTSRPAWARRDLIPYPPFLPPHPLQNLWGLDLVWDRLTDSCGLADDQAGVHRETWEIYLLSEVPCIPVDNTWFLSSCSFSF